MKAIIAAHAKESHCPEKQMQGRTMLGYMAGGPRADHGLHFAEGPLDGIHSHRHVQLTFCLLFDHL